MTRPATAASASLAGEVFLVDVIVAAVRAVPGVAELHGGLFGEAATYLPGRRVAGVRIIDDTAEIHLSVRYGSSVHEVAGAVRRAVLALVRGPVDVVVEDVVEGGADDQPVIDAGPTTGSRP